MKNNRHLWKKWILRFSRNGKFPLVERRKKVSSPWQRLIMIASRRGLQQLSSLTRVLWFKIENPVKRNFNVSSLKDEQREAAVHLLRSKEVVAILPTSFEESLIYQPYATAKEMQMCECWTDIYERWKSLGFPPSLFQQRRTCFYWLEKRNTSLFSEDSGRLFGCKIRNML